MLVFWNRYTYQYDTYRLVPVRYQPPWWKLLFASTKKCLYGYNELQSCKGCQNKKKKKCFIEWRREWKQWFMWFGLMTYAHIKKSLVAIITILNCVLQWTIKKVYTGVKVALGESLDWIKIKDNFHLRGGNGMEWKWMKRIILEYSSLPLFESFNRGNGKSILLSGSLSEREWNG